MLSLKTIFRSSSKRPRSTLNSCFQCTSFATSSNLLFKSFLFLVHPDFFTEHPKEQLTNTESLKILKDIVELPVSNQHVSTGVKHLTFYLKTSKSDKTSPPQKVLLPLGPELMDQLNNILVSTSATHQYTTRVPKHSSTKDSHNEKETHGEKHKHGDQDWAPNHRVRYGGYREPKSVRRIESLQDFLQDLDTADGRQMIQERQEAWNVIMTHQSQICSKYGFRNIEDRSGWSSRNFMQLMDQLHISLGQNKDAFKVSRFEGFSVMIADDTQVSTVSAVEGRIVLSPTDPPGVWMKILERIRPVDVEKAHSINLQVSRLQQQSSRLSGMENVRFKMGRTCDRLEYLIFLDNLCTSHSDYLLDWRKVDLGGAAFQFNVERGSRAFLKENGEFQVGPETSFEQILSLTNRLGQDATERNLMDTTAKQEVQKMIGTCTSKLKLKMILKDPHITWFQMKRASEKLADGLQSHQDFILEKCVRIGTIFNVTEKGDIRIPWQWT